MIDFLKNKFKKKQNIEITALATHEHLIDYMPITIGQKHYPKWFKNLEVPRDRYGDYSNVRLCAGLTDLFRNTFVIPSWQEFEIAVYPDGNVTFNAPNKDDYPVEGHMLEAQAPDAWPGYKNVKLISPWLITSKSDILFQMCQPSWNNSDPCLFHVVTGLVEFKYQHAVHVNMLVPILDEKYIFHIDAGEPLAYLTPLTEKSVEIDYKLVSPEERSRLLHDWDFTFKSSYYLRRKIGKRNANS
jgi:hypothetical protein